MLRFPAVLLTVWLCAVLAPDPATARSAIRYNLGDLTITQLDDLPQSADYLIDGIYYDLGWLHREYSLFYGAFWVFDEQGYALYSKEGGQTRYVALTSGQMAMISLTTGKKYPPHYQMTLWQRSAGLLVFGGLAGLIGLLFLRRWMRD